MSFDFLPANDLSPRAHKTRIIHDLLTPMRDGVKLAMDLIRPVEEGAYPVVLVRTPYNKVGSRTPYLQELAQRGYIVAIQDTRGRDNSDGVFFPYRDDRADGFDTVEWVNEQAWCDGNIGMWGGSYVGQTQWFAAADAPKGLKAIVPIVSPPDAFFNEPVCNGCFSAPDGRVDDLDGPPLLRNRRTGHSLRRDAGFLPRHARLHPARDRR